MTGTQYQLFEKTQQELFDEWVHTPFGGEIANTFIRVAIKMKRYSGHKTYSPWCIAGKVRCDYDMKAKQPDAEEFKLNNNMIAYLSRFAMARCPELKGFLPTRELGKKKKKATRAVIVPIQE